MTRQVFFQELSLLLKKLSPKEREQAILYYGEIIADAMEDGMAEKEAVARLGDINALAASILADHQSVYPILPKLPKSRANHRILWMVLLVISFPLWGSLLLAAVLLLLSAYFLLYVPIFVLGVMAVAFFGGGLWSIIGSPFLMADTLALGVIQLGQGVALLGMALLSAIALIYTLRAVLRATKWLFKKTIAPFRKKEAFA